jgi:hypothetical protein
VLKNGFSVVVLMVSANITRGLTPAMPAGDTLSRPFFKTLLPRATVALDLIGQKHRFE